MGRKSFKKIGSIVFVVFAVMAAWSMSAHAYTFTFDDIKYIANTSSGRNNNGEANLLAAFPGYVGPPNYSSNGFYQVITTNDGTTWSGLNGTNPTPTYIARFSPSFATEFIQNDPNNPPVQFTEGQDRLSLTNWTSAGGTTNGNLVDYAVSGSNSSFNFYGYDPSNPFNSGLVTPFIFNKFDLKGTPGQTVTFVALASDGTTVLDTGSFTFSDSSWHTVVENWSGVTTIDFTSSGTVNMDNVTINEAVAPVPEPATMLLVGSGLLGLAGYGKKRLLKK